MDRTRSANARIVGTEEVAGPSDRRHEIGGIALVVASALAFGTLAITAKYAYRAGATVVPLLAARFALATLLIGLALLVARRRIWVGPRDVAKLVGMGAFGYGVEAALFFAALERAPAGVVGLIFYSYPLWTTVLGFVTRLEPFRWSLVLALALGTGGVTLVFSLPRGGLAGPLLALTAAVSVAIYFILMQVILRDVDPAPAAFWTSFGAMLMLGTGALVMRDPLPSGAFVPAVGLALASSFAFLTMYAGIVRIGSSRAAVAAMLEPVTTLVLAAILLDEELTARVLLGAILVVAALPILALQKRKPEPPVEW